MKQPGRPRASLIITVINAPGRINRRRRLIFSKLSVRARKNRKARCHLLFRGQRDRVICPALFVQLCTAGYRDFVPRNSFNRGQFRNSPPSPANGDYYSDRRLISIITRNPYVGSGAFSLTSNFVYPPLCRRNLFSDRDWRIFHELSPIG